MNVTGEGIPQYENPLLLQFLKIYFVYTHYHVISAGGFIIIGRVKMAERKTYVYMNASRRGSEQASLQLECRETHFLLIPVFFFFLLSFSILFICKQIPLSSTVVLGRMAVMRHFEGTNYFVILWPVKAKPFFASFCIFIDWTQEMFVFSFSPSVLCDKSLVCLWVFLICRSSLMHATRDYSCTNCFVIFFFCFFFFFQ